MRVAGLRPVQFWVHDTRCPDFAALIKKQCQSLKDDPTEIDIMHFSEEAANQIEGWE